MIGIVNAGGGGLMLDVTGGTTAPVSLMENLIWVNTADPITSWAVLDKQPALPETEEERSAIDGKVIFIQDKHLAETGVEISPYPRSVTITPELCFQYKASENTWITKEATVYKMVDSVLTPVPLHNSYLYNRGSWNTKFNSWASSAPSGYNASTPIENPYDFEVKVSPGEGSKSFTSEFIINTAEYKQIVIEYNSYASSTYYIYFPQITLVDENNRQLYSSNFDNTTQTETKTIDISTITVPVRVRFLIRRANPDASAYSSTKITSFKLVPND